MISNKLKKKLLQKNYFDIVEFGLAEWNNELDDIKFLM